ncbi:hypothetical protein EV138_4844 [Kribbella voronezhensis]|uniref:Uncharacterized protein n=1 Tax=Kribbella voronezhensis TaxID=2512212 RepID=A0A4R7TG50_9ACTN|nr:hypothetical protein [Kribbella voronezhensis]TDU91242.1 hypothetical protein EV138_4844 [Kribbella voronezhensis]
MSNLTTPPDHELPRPVRDRQRDELVAIVDHEFGAPRRRTAVPLLAAAATVAVIAGLAFGVPALKGDKTAPAGTAPAAGGTKVASGNTPKDAKATNAPPLARPIPAEIRQLGAAETAAFRNQCIEFTKGAQRSFASFEVIHAFEYVETARPGLTKSWLVARKGMDYWICSRSGDGSIAGDSAFGPNISPAGKDVPYLFAPVDGRGEGTGMYIPSVARVTVQHHGDAPVEAVLKDGFWFAPMEQDSFPLPTNGAKPTRQDNHLIGVMPGWTIRGYDGAGKLVYDSAKNGPRVEKCYSNPARTEVLVVNSVKHPTPATCEQLFDWK